LTLILTHERLLELLAYDPATGVFTRRVDVGGRAKRFKAGTVAGCVDRSVGYVRITVDGRHLWAHRLAWFYVHGAWPLGQVDHINRERVDNRIANLRDVPQAINLQNRADARGVCWEPHRRKWRATVSVENRNRFLGRFDTEEAARAAYLSAKRAAHPGFLG
jgi:hypothetical protein